MFTKVLKTVSWVAKCRNCFVRKAVSAILFLRCLLRYTTICLLNALTLFGMTTIAFAELQPRYFNQELYAVYDTDRNITYLANANVALINDLGIPNTNGRFTFANAGNFINALNGLGQWPNPWRLPVSADPDNTCTDLGGTPTGWAPVGYNCTGSDLGHLFYDELGGTAGLDISVSGDPTLLAFFNNIHENGATSFYWSSTLSATNNAISFSFSGGVQQYRDTSFLNEHLVWPIMDGDIDAVPDLEILKIGPADPVAIGENFTYTLSVFNIGTADATNVIAMDTLPPGVAFVSSSPGGRCNASGGHITTGIELTCDFGLSPMNSLEKETITVTAPSQPGIITNQVTVTCDETERETDNNSAEEDTEIELPGVEITDTVNEVDDKLLDFGDVLVGTIETGSLTITNTSALALAIGSLQTELDPPFHIVDPALCFDTTLDPSGSANDNCTLEVEFTPTEETPEGAEETANFLIPFDQFDVQIDFSGRGVEDQANIVVIKTTLDNKLTMEANDQDMITFIITVTNNGPSPVDVSVSEQLPAGMYIPDGLTYTSTMGDWNGNTWTIGEMADDASAVLTIPTVATDGTSGCLINNATGTIETPGIENLNPYDDSSQVIIGTGNCADVEAASITFDDSLNIDCIVSGSEGRNFNVFTYYRVVNNGPDVATNVTIERRNGLFRVGALNPGESHEIRDEQLIDCDVADYLYERWMIVDSTSIDPNDLNNTREASTTVIGLPRGEREDEGDGGSGGCFIDALLYLKSFVSYLQ
jgi:uncharacterized repeat protein (TIGR01451 family)